MSQIRSAGTPAHPSETELSILNNEPLYREKTQNSKGRWGAVVLITGALCAGLAFAVGHDRYNHYLDGKQVDEINISQEWVSRIATAFAFLVKSTLASAIAASYAQRLWSNVRSRAFEVRSVDVLMAAPTDVFLFLFSFLHPRAWFRVPGMLMMGIAIWCIPLAAVIPPGTLIVVYNPVSNITNLQVPQLSYNSSTWASIGPLSSYFQFWSASAGVQRAGFAAATTGEVIGVYHTYTNESYTLNFSGPAIQCSPASNQVRDKAQKFFKGHAGSGGHISYFSWVEGNDHGILSDNSTFDEGGTWDSLDVSSSDAARIFIYSTMGGNSDDLRNVSECLLYNASYTVEFRIENGISQATPELTMGDQLAGMAQLSSDSDSYDVEGRIHYAYQAVMDVFGKLLVGYAFAQNGGTKVLYSSFQRTYVNFREMEETQRDLETLFQNITLSMFSDPSLLLDSTQASQVPVQVTSYPLTYRYLPRDLWISYGTAILATLIAALGGLQAVWVGGASYSSRFSTVARITKNAGLDHFIAEEDDGSGPLPRAIGKTQFRIRSEMNLMEGTG